ncbi:MAG: ROK family protein [Candidatus Abyssubacteria bacterium]
MKPKATGHILALDIGGTKLAAGLFDPELNLIGRARIPTHAEQGPDAVCARIVRLMESLANKHGIDAAELCCIGAGCGGPLDSETGIIYSPPNLPGWDAYPLKKKLEEHFDLPAFVENDANAAAMAEHRFGAGRGYRNIFYITMSTGIGCGIILDGRLYRGTNYSAGEFGHIVMARRGPKCNCGGRGCLEALASGTAIARRALREADRTPNSPLARIFRKKGALTARDVAAVARRGDQTAKRILLDAAYYLGLGITSAIHLLNPQIIIIGGGLSKMGPMLFEPVRTTVKERAQTHLAYFVSIVPAALGANVGLYGALSVALDRISS